MRTTTSTKPELRAKQFATAIILAELEAIKNQHPEEDNDNSEDEADILDAPFITDTDSSSMLEARPRGQGRRGRKSTKVCVPSNRLNNSLMMKILLRREMTLIPNLVKNLLDLFLTRKQVKPTIQPVHSSQLVPDGASSLLPIHPCQDWIGDNNNLTTSCFL